MLTSIALTSRILGGISLTSGVLERVGPDTRDAVAAAAGDGIAPSNDLVARWRYHRPQIETPYSNKPMIFYGWQAGGLDYVFRTETLKAEKPRQYPVALRLQLEPRDPDSVDVLRSIAVSGTIDGQVAGSVSIVVRSKTTVPAEKTAAVKVATVKTSTVKTAAVKSSAMKTSSMKTSSMKTSAPETSAMGLGSSNTDRRGERDSNDGNSHQQFAGHGDPPFYIRDPISASDLPET